MTLIDKQDAKLNKESVRLSLTSFNWNMAFRAIFEGICGSGSFVFVAYALAMGLPGERIGFLNAAISFACLIQMASLFVVNYVSDRKNYVIKLALAEPLVVLGAVGLAPFMSQEWRIVFLLVAVFMAAAFVNLTSPLVQDWLSTIIPAGLRGRYLGRRWQMQGIAAIATTLCAGYLLDRIGKTNIHGISILLAGGTLFGVMAVLMLNRIKLPPVAVATTVTWSSIAEVIAYKPFRRYLWAYFLFNVPFYLSVPYYQVFNLEVLHMRPSTVGYILATYTGLRIITYGFWGRIIDRGYLKPAVYIPAVAYVFFFLGYPLSSPDRVWPLFIAWGLAGLADSATIVSTTALSYRSLPEGSATRPAYFAVLSLFSTGLYAIGALIAVPILVGLRHVTLTIGGLHLTHFHIFYFALMVMMVFSAIASRLFFAGDKPAPSAATATATD